MISISVCMIVKDEEEVLARCLNSLAGIADEIIIVDTGSGDATKQIAAAYTERIYDFAWVDDFSAARNYSFSKATMEYIYVADADEVIEEGERQKFLKLKRELDRRVEIVQMLYTNQLSCNLTRNCARNSTAGCAIFSGRSRFTRRCGLHRLFLIRISA